MARATMVITTMSGSYDVDGVNLTGGFTDFDEGNDMEFAMVGGEILIFTKTGTGSSQVTVLSVNDPFSRTGNLVKTVLLNDIVIFGPMQTTGFKTSAGLLQIDGDATAGLEYIILRP